jgi:hydroxymethylpyrimidine/phosphomethylpyrimidine kinase
MSVEPRVPTVISIAGSDSGGGAGIQADLKAFARCGIHGTTAITALTAQNTVGVESVLPTPPEMIVAQVRAVASDIGIDAVKIGMLGDEPTIDAVIESLGVIESYRRGVPVVLDPVMVAESGAALLDPNAKAALIERLLPLVTVVTPNLPEARELAGRREGGTQGELGEAILALGPDAVIVTGGHTEKGADVLVDENGRLEIEGPRFADGAAHGSGCTHSSAVAALLARGMELDEAARWAREIAAEAVGHGLREIGEGPGPVDVLRIRRREIDPPQLGDAS